MTPATIIREAEAGGVRLSLTPSGTIKATGEGAAVTRWLSVIREHKAGIVAELKVGADGTAQAQRIDPFASEAGEVQEGDDDRRRCSQCFNLTRSGVCRIAEPVPSAVVVANRGYKPVQNILRRCQGFNPGRTLQ